MFIPKTFKIDDEQEIHQFIEENGFGQLISNKEGRLLSTHLPFLLSEDKTKLIGHLAKINSQSQDLDNQNILVTLQGAHDYISPSWYVGAGVPTWNYQAVHINGHCKTFTDPDLLKTAVNDLAHKYESKRPKPWKPEYNEAMLRAIVGFEITISDIQCQYKLSQNRSPEDRKEIIEQLEKLGSHSLVKAMKENKP